MDEQEIIAVLRAHVARAQSNGNQQPAEGAPVHAPRVEHPKAGAAVGRTAATAQPGGST